MEKIDHIVYLMLENRSFDSVLGWLYEKELPKHFIPVNSQPKFEGVNTSMYNPDAAGKKIYVSKITPDQGQQIPSVDPNEDFQHVQQQIANNMQGFYKDFLSQGSRNPKEIMACYTPESLPVLNFLAKHFAVSDAYFSSIPTQTNCNRAFSLAGNSIGWWSHINDKKGARVDNEWTSELDPFEFTERTIWNVLAENGYSSTKDWSVFYSQTWPGHIGGNYCFTQDLFWSKLKDYTPHFKSINDFYTLASKGELPTFSYLEPAWYEELYNGNDYHPPANLSPGEQFLNHLYNVLRTSPKWGRTLLMINFDEHGGTFDHIEPPSALAPWSYPNDGTPEPALKEYNFNFKQFGVRVPLILVSPLIEEQTVFRSSTNIPFDHTSVLATILKHFNIPVGKWQLGSRTANAPTFENVITLSEARNNISPIPDPVSSNIKSETNTKPNDLHIMMTKRMISRYIQSNNLPQKKCRKIFEVTFRDIENMKMSDLNKAIQIVIEKMDLLKASGTN